MSFNRILFEYPSGWTDIGSDPLAPYNVKCLDTIRLAASELGIDFQEETSIRMADFAQRFSPRDTLLISVHSIGVAHNVVRLKESYLPGQYYFDRSGYSGWAELAYNEEMQKKALSYDVGSADAFVRQLREIKIRENSSKYQQPDFSCIDNVALNNKNYLLLALQTSDDLVAYLSNIDQLTLAEELAKTLLRNDMLLVIKRHPLCNDYKVEKTIQRLMNTYYNVISSTQSVNKLITNAKAVVTVNSGVGFESLVMGTPVVTAGRSDYSFVTRTVSNVDDIAHLPELIQRIDRVNVASMIKYYIEEYCITCGDIHKAIRFISRWQSDEYANMSNLQGYESHVLGDCMNYIARLEANRRVSCMTNIAPNRFRKLIDRIGAAIH